MNEKYLVINAGSTSLKFSLYYMPSGVEIVRGSFDNIGQVGFYKLNSAELKIADKKKFSNHKDAIDTLLSELLKNNFIVSLNEIKGIGHRVVHGGEKYKESVIIDPEVIGEIGKLSSLAPLHNPAALSGILALQVCLPEIPQVAVFDTAFHQTMPIENYFYPVPYEWYEKYGIRKYGFHGTSNKYLTEQAQQIFGRENINTINIQLGGGTSITTVKNGKSLYNSMGATPLPGAMMASRTGDIDPSIPQLVVNASGLTYDEVYTKLNKKSGWYAFTREVDYRNIQPLLNKKDEQALLGYSIYINSIIDHVIIGINKLKGNVDAVIFTAGIGENNAEVRKDIINGISDITGIILDEEENNKVASFKDQQSGRISQTNSTAVVLVIPTNEELMILRDTHKLIGLLQKENQLLKIDKSIK